MRQHKDSKKSLRKIQRRRKPSKGPIEPMGQLAATAGRTRTLDDLPPNENLHKDPDETYGDMELPFRRK
jgi:hypothetical protein